MKARGAVTLRGRARRAGLTLVELVLSAALLAILIAAVFKLIRDFMEVWDKSEVRRMQVEEASGVAQLFAEDFHSLEPGPRGDLLAEWVFFDTDGDGVGESKWPRIRLVRHASQAELARMQAGLPANERVIGDGSIEVIWTILPAYAGNADKDLRPLGFLWRGDRVAGAARGADVSLFDERYLGAAGTPRPGTTNEVTSGVLWLGMQFATQTTILNDGWQLGREVGDAVACWDAWALGRPNAERHVWNDPADFLPEPSEAPLLPRRVRLEFEFERPQDFKRRTRLSSYLGPQQGGLEVDDGGKLPAAGAYVLIDAEWMQVTDTVGDTVSVRRGQRGTKAVGHESGALVHYGRTLVREMSIATHREDWDL